MSLSDTDGGQPVIIQVGEIYFFPVDGVTDATFVRRDVKSSQSTFKHSYGGYFAVVIDLNSIIAHTLCSMRDQRLKDILQSYWDAVVAAGLATGSMPPIVPGRVVAL